MPIGRLVHSEMATVVFTIGETVSSRPRGSRISGSAGITRLHHELDANRLQLDQPDDTDRITRVPRSVIVVPCFNEEARFSANAFRDFAHGWPGGSFILVDDGSTDGTLGMLTALQESMPHCFEILCMPRNVGKAEAVRHGILRAFLSASEYVGYWDADLATPLEALPLFESVLRERPSTEIVFGARVKLLGRDIRRNRVRHYLGRCFATAIAVVLGVAVYDPQCGAKLFRVSNAVRAAFAEPFLSRWIFDVEILARFITRHRAASDVDVGTLVYELPLPVWHDIRGSKLHATDFFQALVDLWRIYRSQAL